MSIINASKYAYFDKPFAAMAHRGGWTNLAEQVRENTLYSFQNAFDLGFSYLETDVRTTKDGILMAVHDPDLTRVAGHKVGIEDLTFTQLRELKINGTDCVPTLAELLESLPKARFNIDIKEPKAIRPLFDTICKYRAEDRVCVASFSRSNLHRFRALAGRRIATAISSAAVAWSAFMPLLPQYLNSPGQVFQIPATIQVGGRKISIVSKRLITTAHKRDLRVHVWTINDRAEMHHLIDLKVDGLISDRIDILAEVVKERGLWS